MPVFYSLHFQSMRAIIFHLSGFNGSKSVVNKLAEQDFVLGEALHNNCPPKPKLSRATVNALQAEDHV